MIKRWLKRKTEIREIRDLGAITLGAAYRAHMKGYAAQIHDGQVKHFIKED